MSNAAAAPDNNPAVRRKALVIRDNPRTDRDYIVSVHKVLTRQQEADAAAEITCQIRYVPDRHICDTSQLEEYFILLAREAFDGAEELANAIADDFCNEVIPRWLSVGVTWSPGEAQSGPLASVHVEDRQPHWDNPSLLGLPQGNSGKSRRTGASMGQIKSPG